MTKGITNVVLAGLGGQGIITASDILSDAAFRAGYDVKKSELRGLSQRRGVVVSDVRFGTKVLSPMVPSGEADYLLVLEESLLSTTRKCVMKEGLILTARFVSAAMKVPERAMNLALLGVLSTYLAIPERIWITAIKANLPPHLHETNKTTFLTARKTKRI